VCIIDGRVVSPGDLDLDGYIVRDPGNRDIHPGHLDPRHLGKMSKSSEYATLIDGK